MERYRIGLALGYWILYISKVICSELGSDAPYEVSKGKNSRELKSSLSYIFDKIEEKHDFVLFVRVHTESRLSKIVKTLQNVQPNRTAVVLYVCGPSTTPPKPFSEQDAPQEIKNIEVSKLNKGSTDRIIKKEILKSSSQPTSNPGNNILQAKSGRISDIVLVRAMCMLSNYILVNTCMERSILSSFFGVPSKKIHIVFQKEESSKPNLHLAKLDRKITQPTLKSINSGLFADNRSSISPILINLPNYFPVKNGLYALFCSNWISINALITKKRVKGLYVRTVLEKPGQKLGIYDRGPYNRMMYESFISISKDRVYLKVHTQNTIQHKKNSVYIYTPGAMVEIDIFTLKIRIELRDGIVTGRGLGLAKKNMEKWRFSSESNLFSCRHRFLKCKINDFYAYLYNRPRRSIVQAFDPKTSVSPLHRVTIFGHFSYGGYGLVSQEFLLSTCADQRLFIRAIADKGMVYHVEKDYNVFLVCLYMKEVYIEEQLIPERQKIAAFRHKGVFLQNKFPPDLDVSFSSNYKLVVHFPWEFDTLPSAIENPIIQKNTDILVPSLYAKKAHIQSGLSPSRIRVIPHGVSFHTLALLYRIEKKLYSNLSISNMFKCRKKCTRFVIVNGALERKGIDIAIKAYIKAFKAEDDVVLRVNCAYGDPHVKQKILKLLLENKRKNGPRIVWTLSPVLPEIVRNILGEAHYNISSFRGEGFGLTTLEGMVFGTVPIVTNSLPATEFCSKNNAFLIPCVSEECKLYPVTTKDGRVSMFEYELPKYPIWKKPSLPALVKILRKAHRMRVDSPEKYNVLRCNCIEVAKAKTWTKELRKLQAVFMS